MAVREKPTTRPECIESASKEECHMECLWGFTRCPVVYKEATDGTSG